MAKLEDLVGNVVAVSEEENMITLNYANENGSKYSVVITSNGFGRMHVSTKDAPYKMCATDKEGEPTFEIASILDWELHLYLISWGNLPVSEAKEWADKIRNGDRFYGGHHVNQVVITRRE